MRTSVIRAIHTRVTPNLCILLATLSLSATTTIRTPMTSAPMMGKVVSRAVILPFPPREAGVRLCQVRLLLPPDWSRSLHRVFECYLGVSSSSSEAASHVFIYERGFYPFLSRRLVCKEAILWMCMIKKPTKKIVMQEEENKTQYHLLINSLFLMMSTLVDFRENRTSSFD